MDFAVPATLAPILERIDRLLVDHVIPAETEVLARGFVASAPLLDGLRATVKAAGLWGPQLPRDVGGLGLSLLEHGLVSERLGRSPLGHYAFGAQAPDAGNLEILHKWGTPEQQARWLAPLAAGAIRSCFSMTERDNPGSNPVLQSCSATKDGDDYVIDGHKRFTSGADGAAFAVVMAVTNPDAAPHGRASMIIVPTDTPGFVLERNIPIMGDAGGGWASHGEIRYDHVRVPQTNRLGAEGAGFLIAQERLGPGRIHHCMRWIGICERAFDIMCSHAATRERIAEARCQIEQARLLTLKAAWMMDKAGNKAAQTEIAMIKVVAPNMACRVIDWAIQAHGGGGMSQDFPLAYFYTVARTLRFADGPDEVHRNAIAKIELGKVMPAKA